MRRVAWIVVVWVSACAKSGGGTAAPTQTTSETAAVSAAPSVTSSAAPMIASHVPITESPALPSASATAAVGSPAGGKGGNCLVTVGDIQIIRPCEGKPNERKAPSSNVAASSPKMCERIEHTADGDIVVLRPCSQ